MEIWGLLAYGRWRQKDTALADCWRQTVPWHARPLLELGAAKSVPQAPVQPPASYSPAGQAGRTNFCFTLAVCWL